MFLAPPNRRFSAATVLLVSLLAGLAAVTGESLWIDEANSALKAMQPSLAAWWHVLASEKGSDLQMPLYMLQLWAWEKLSGSGEFSLRSVNIIWFCLGQLALFYASRRQRCSAWVTVSLGAIHPLLWYYLNDARPYLMQYAAACLLCAVLFRENEDQLSIVRPGSIWAFGIGLLMLCGSSLLGVIWAGGAVGAWCVLLSGRRRKLPNRQILAPLVATAACLTLLGGFYLWTIWLGTGASKVGNTGLLNLAFISYEFSGVGGLGPGRLQVRQNGFEAFLALGSFRLLSMIAAAFLSLGVFCQGLRIAARNLPWRGKIATSIYCLPAGLFLIALGYLRDFRVLGRHFLPLLPPVLGVMALGIASLLSTRRRLGLVTLIALGCAWSASCLSFRFAERHRKDDYRSAAEVAKASLARKEIVWWSADRSAAIYYGVPFAPSSTDEEAVVLILLPERADLARLAEPDTVIASKPDIYAGRTDPLGAYLLARGFESVRDLPAFIIWRSPAAPIARP